MSRQSLPVSPGDEAGPCVAAAATGPSSTDADPGRRGAQRAAWRSRTRRGDLRDAGMATAEYAIVTLAAAGFGGLLIVLLRSDEVRGLLAGLVRGALTP